MSIDLLALAKQVETEYYKDVELSIGIVRVYHVPEPMIWTYKLDKPAPVQPMIIMKTTAGIPDQERPIKPTDKGYTEWLLESQAYEDEVADIRIAARFVLALRDIKYPDISQPPPLAARYLNGHYPDNEMLRRKIWLDHTVLARSTDLALVQATLMELASGTISNADNVDEIKKNSVSTGAKDNLALSEEKKSK